MSAECLESPGLLLLHLQSGSWLCHLPKARRSLQEQDCLVQMHLRALSVSPLCSLREKPSRIWSCLTPPRYVKETSLHVRSCHRALLQCGGGFCRKRWMRASAGGDYSCLVQLCVDSLEGALSGFLLRPAGRLKSSPTQGPFMSICYKPRCSQARFGNEPPVAGSVHVQPGPRPAATPSRPALVQERG